MTRSPNHRFPFAVVVLTFACIGGTSNIVAQTPKAATIAAPLIFEQNNGQAPARYHFLARRSGMETLYAADGVDIFVAQSRSTAARLQISWKGANRAATASGEAPLPGHSNYLRGSDPALWLRNIPQFSRVRYQQIYPGSICYSTEAAITSRTIFWRRRGRTQLKSPCSSTAACR